jgi:signal transduction histidine kinase
VLGHRSSRLRDWGLFVLVALLPTVAVAALGLRALRNEEAAVRREMQLQLGRTASELERRFAAQLQALETASLPRPDALAPPHDMPWADAVVLGPDASLIAPEPPLERAQSADAPRECPELAAQAREGAGEARVGARRRFLARCEAAQSSDERWLWPVLALDPSSAEPVEPGRIEAWFRARSALLSDAERSAARDEVQAAASLPAEAKAPILAALDSTEPRGRALRAALGLIRARLRAAIAAAAPARWREAASVGELRPTPSGGLAGFVVHPASIARAVRNGWPELPEGMSTRVVVGQGRPAGASAELLPGGLFLELRWAGEGPVATRTTRSIGILLGTAVLAAAVAIALASFLFARIRAERRLGALRTDFVATVSHELRTPITSLRMLSELLEQDAVEPEGRAEIYAALSREARRLGNTVDRLLTFSRMQAQRSPLAAEEVSVPEVVCAAIDTFEERHPGVKVTRPAATPEPRAAVDRAQLGMALDNLLSNALKYAPAGAPYEVEVQPSESEVRIVVRDRGPGVAPRDRRRIFEPFERADNRLSQATEGSGIGLSLVRHVARAHGGRAWVESNDGSGASFFVAIPRPQPARGASPSPKESA